MTKCTTCGATYAPVQADGTRYFHACAPLSDAEVCAALAISPDPTKWTAADKVAIAAAPRVRVNARDENITSAAPSPTAAPMKSAGAGVTTVP